jgi:hypothetical protein
VTAVVATQNLTGQTNTGALWASTCQKSIILVEDGGLCVVAVVVVVVGVGEVAALIL